MSRAVEYVLTRGGVIERRDITTNPIQLPANIQDQLAAYINMKIPAMFMLESNPVDICAKQGAQTFYSVSLDALILNTSFRMNGKVMFPVFNGTDNVMSLPWPAQKNMTLRFVVLSVHDPLGKKHRLGQVYLIAYDEKKQAYKLPLANLYDDCRLCHGQNSPWVRTGADVVLEALRNFGTSRWNGDLWKDAEKSQKMFSFQATQEGFNPIPVEDWKPLCDKVATPITELATP